VKKLLLVLFIAGTLVLTGWLRMMPAPMQTRFDEWLGPLLGTASPEFDAFQTFATALVRGDIKTVATLTDDADVKERASRASVSLRRSVRDVLQVAYRADSERASSDGAATTLDVSQGLTLDPHGVTSAFGTMTCEGRYTVTMVEAAGAWKVASLRFLPPVSQPAESNGAVVPAPGVQWPCADSAWTTFATAWKSTVLR
jgi:hypothetical protein